MDFCELTKKEFQTFIDHHPLKSFVQLPEMGDYKEKHHFDVFYVGVKTGKKIICATMMFTNGRKIGRSLFYAPNGYLIDYEDKELLSFFTQQIKLYIKKKKGYALIIDPYLPLIERDINGEIVKNGFSNKHVISSMKQLGYEYTGTTNQVKKMFVLDIEKKNKKEIWDNFSSKVKNSIKKSLKEGITFRELNYEELTIFKEITSSSAEKHQFADRPLSYYQEMYQLFVPKKLAKFVVCEIHYETYQKELIKEQNEIQKQYDKLSPNNGRRKDCEDALALLKKQQEELEHLKNQYGKVIPLSASLFMLYGDEVIYLFSGNRKEAMTFCTAYRIQWEMIQYAIKNNYKTYNFYGIMGTKKGEKEFGVYHFKKGFNGTVVELIGEFILPITKFYHIKKILKKMLSKIRS